MDTTFLCDQIVRTYSMDSVLWVDYTHVFYDHLHHNLSNEILIYVFSHLYRLQLFSTLMVVLFIISIINKLKIKIKFIITRQKMKKKKKNGNLLTHLSVKCYIFLFVNFCPCVKRKKLNRIYTRGQI